METRKESKQELYDYYFDNPWCPLIGPLLLTDHLPNSTVFKAFKIIEQARHLWDLPVISIDVNDTQKRWMIYVTPEDFISYFPEINLSEEMLVSARRIFWEGINISMKSQLAHSPDHPKWSKDAHGKTVEYLAPDQAKSSRIMLEVGNYWEVSTSIKEWQVYSILAIRWAYFMLKLILKCNESDDNLKMIESLRVATSYLNQATEHKVRLKDEYIKATDQDRQRGNKTIRSASKGGTAKALAAKQNRDEWQNRADNIWQSNPSLSKLSVARLIVMELHSEGTKPPDKDWIARNIKKP